MVVADACCKTTEWRSSKNYVSSCIVIFKLFKIKWQSFQWAVQEIQTARMYVWFLCTC